MGIRYDNCRSMEEKSNSLGVLWVAAQILCNVESFGSLCLQMILLSPLALRPHRLANTACEHGSSWQKLSSDCERFAKNILIPTFFCNVFSL